jgi:hypothetical protein
MPSKIGKNKQQTSYSLQQIISNLNIDYLCVIIMIEEKITFYANSKPSWHKE